MLPSFAVVKRTMMQKPKKKRKKKQVLLLGGLVVCEASCVVMIWNDESARANRTNA
jgi:hypothetical protein